MKTWPLIINRRIVECTFEQFITQDEKSMTLEMRLARLETHIGLINLRKTFNQITTPEELSKAVSRKDNDV